MALIERLEEVKEVLPNLVSNLSDTSRLPNFSTAEIKYLVPLIGMAQYNDLQAKYISNTLSVTEDALVNHARLLIAVNAFRDDMIINHVMWTDQGLRTMATQELGKPVGWEYKKLESFFNDRSADAEEVLLTYLWANKASFPLWTASDEYQQFISLLIRTGTDFKNQYRSLYQPMRTYYQLQPVVSEVQEKYLEAGIGRELLAYLIAGAGLSNDEIYAIALLKKALAYFTIKEACVQLPIRIDDGGFTIASQRGGDPQTDDAGRAGATAAMIESLKDNCNKEGQNYLSKARYELYKSRNKGTSSAGFNTAFDAGLLAGYVPPSERESGNQSRHFFAMG